MRHVMPILLVVAGTVAGGQRSHAQPESVAAVLAKAKTALAAGHTEEALRLAGMAVTREPENSTAYLLRGSAYAVMLQHEKAVADFDTALRLDPKAAEAYDRRGSERFKLGHVREAAADFDKFLELKPRDRPGHWRRGIALYYAGRFDDGRRQFEGYESVDTNDVENAVWHFLCYSRVVGVEKARAAMLKIGHDRRVPLMAVYDLFRGKASPDDVLKAAEAGNPAPQERKQRLFYAHLYLGLYAEVSGDRRAVLEHLNKAADDFPQAGYMWDVARVHRDLLRQAKQKDRDK